MPPINGPSILVVMRSSSACRDTDVLHQLLYFLGRCSSYLGYSEGYCEVHDRANNTKCVGFDTHEPVGRCVTQERSARDKHDALVLEHVEQGDPDAADHARYGAFLGDNL